jgi:hypothetical protein
MVNVIPPLLLPPLPSHPTNPRTLLPSHCLPNKFQASQNPPDPERDPTHRKEKPPVPGLQTRFTDMGLYEFRRGV